MKKSFIIFSLILAAALCACLVVSDSNADAPSFGGKACVTNCCDKTSGGKDYIGCKSICEKKADRQKCLSECSEKMQKAYQACLIADCKMDKGLASVTIKCNK